MPDKGERTTSGRICVFLSRSCGALSSIIILVCGFVTLIPLPSQIAGSISRCIPTGLVIIIAAVIMFFLEATVLGYCFDRISFLVAVSKYVNSWMRFVLYLLFSIIPILFWCLSASTILSLGLFFVVCALNFVLAIGTKGEHASTYARVTLSELNKAESGVGEGNDDGDESDVILKESAS